MSSRASLGLLPLACCLLPFALTAQSSSPAVAPGPHAAGFRLVETWDHGRAARPPFDYLGQRASGELSVPMQIGIWYPAERGGRPMTFRDLQLIAIKRDRFGPITARDSQEVVDNMGWAVRMTRADSTLPSARPEAGLSRATAAVRDARAARGSFPVAVVGSSGSIASVSVLAEHLASHGWLVLTTPSSNAAGTLEATMPRLAIEDRLAAMEFLVATARTLPGADPHRLAVIGVNFDSFAALEYQMRYMRAAAVVTINGWQTIETRFEHLRNSLWFDPARIRVPVFNVHWDETSEGIAPANLTFLRELRYADRHHVVVRGLDHFGLVGNPLGYPFTSAEQRTGYEYLVRAIRAFLEAATGGNADSARAVITEPATSGFPRDLLKSQWYRAAQPMMPTRTEFAEIVWEKQDLPGALRLLREARAQDTTVQLFREGELNLYAFRYQRQGKLDDALAVHRLTLEAYPGSFYARNNIGGVLLLKADTTGAIREFEAALELLGRSSRLAPAEKTAQETAWREKIARLRGRP